MKRWECLYDFFKDINENCNYVVLRNGDDIDWKNSLIKNDGDLDVLCENRKAFIELSGAVPIYSSRRRDNYYITVANHKVRIDIRYVGDRYYDKNWEKDRLLCRQFNGLYYLPDETNDMYSVIYHILLQKKYIPEKYRNGILSRMYGNSFKGKTVSDTDIAESMMKDLIKYLQFNYYCITVPHDCGVYFNYTNAGKMSCNISYIQRAFRRLRYKIESRR